MENSQSTENSEFLNRYSILIDDIKYLKSRQWTITYYLLLLYAAIIGFYKLMGFDDGTGYCIEKSVLIILTFLIAALGTVYQCVFQSRLSRYRTLLKGTLNHLSDAFRDFELDRLRERFRNQERYTSWSNGFYLFTLPFIVIFWIGVGLIFWYFFYK